MAEQDTSTDTPFNMAMLYYIELHKLREAKSRAVIENNIVGYYDCLEELYIAISFKLKKQEKEDLEEKFEEAKEALTTEVEGSIAYQVRSLNINNAKKLLKEIDMELINLMHKNNMIFPKIDARGLKDLDKRYGI